ncbi:arabinan endo-1,5-alpha-L-arabinosidase [bacterium A37T11]|nr:arabinan endo-1,5-alpha-L-arabinosidase [bacterium A37T11]
MQTTKKITPFSLLFLICISCGKTSSGQPEPGPELPLPKTYRNPVFEPVLADPSVVRDPNSGMFYAYGTEDDWGDGHGGRLVPVIRSSDLVNWEVVGQAFNTKPSWKQQGGIWAPDVVLVNGQYNLYYAYSTWGDSDPGIGVATSSRPEGPFTDHGKLFLSNEIGVPNSIDPFYLEDHGKKYVFWGSFSNLSNQGTYGVALSDDGLRVPDLSTKFKVAAGDYEAVMIHQREGYYYFFGSKGSCCEGVTSTYHVLVARSKQLEGPYLDKNGEDIQQRGKGTLLLQGNESFVGPGHNARIITDDAGSDWFLYHAIDKKQGKLPSGASRRVLMLDPLTWKDGWPVIDRETPSITEQPIPAITR